MRIRIIFTTGFPDTDILTEVPRLAFPRLMHLRDASAGLANTFNNPGSEGLLLH